MTNVTKARPVPPETPTAEAARAGVAGVAAFVVGAALMAGAMLALASFNLVPDAWMHVLPAPFVVAAVSGVGGFSRARLAGSVLGVAAVLGTFVWFFFLLEW